MQVLGRRFEAFFELVVEEGDQDDVLLVLVRDGGRQEGFGLVDAEALVDELGLSIPEGYFWVQIGKFLSKR